MNWSALVKFFTGFSLAIALLFFAGVSTARFLITRLTAPPPRPTFPNDDPNFAASPSPAQPGAASASPSPEPPVDSSPSPTPSPTPSPSPSPTPSPPTVTPSPPTDEPGAYDARVTQSIGLVIRQEPNRSAAQVGGVSYDQSIVVLETSPDGEWLHVRVPDSGLEGWVKAGNTEPANQ